MVKLVLVYDMRAPDFGGPAVDLYQAALDQCAWGDALGFERVRINEHHAAEDGYLPSPVVFGAGVAGRTRKLLIELVMLLPLYHPLRAAEDLAVLDLVSGGRLQLTAAAGYRPVEYEMFGAEFRKRPSLMERNIEILKQAWSGEPFEHEGREVQILPRPAQRPRPPIFMGGSSRPAAERAARIADGYRPVMPALYEDYRQAVAAQGRAAEPMQPAASYQFLHVSKTPDEDWRRIAPYALHENNSYGRWLAAAGGGPYHEVTDADQLRAEGRYRVVTPEECVEMARTEGVVSLKPLAGGLDPETSWRSLRLFEQEVLPRLRAA